MRGSKLARQYAQALVEAAVVRGLVGRVEKDLDEVRSWWELAEFRLFLSEVRIPVARKKEVLAQLGQGRLDPLTIHFLQLVVERGRQRALPAICEAYRAQADIVRRQVRADVFTAQPLEPGDLELLRQRLEVFSGRVVSLRPVVDSSLLGGVRIQLGDLILDGSVAGRLRRLEQRLLRVALPAEAISEPEGHDERDGRLPDPGEHMVEGNEHGNPTGRD
ncbi:MAG: ATP synthase F1 subunit delta [Limnochordaceae bacterium]|nr:ATP synthase F1 subunit delta [Limnochordaceae bacterium]